MENKLNKLIRQSFDEICQKRHVSIYTTGLHAHNAVTHKELALIIDALIDAVAVEVRIHDGEMRSQVNGN